VSCESYHRRETIGSANLQNLSRRGRRTRYDLTLLYPLIFGSPGPGNGPVDLLAVFSQTGLIGVSRLYTAITGRSTPLPEFPEPDIRTCRGSANMEEEFGSEPTDRVMGLFTLNGAAPASAMEVSTRC
jgi:hypothetical protein